MPRSLMIPTVLVAAFAPVSAVLLTANNSAVTPSTPPEVKAVVDRENAISRPTFLRFDQGIVWADRVFLSPAIAKSWLGPRGVRYAQWASRHPAAAKRLATASK